MVPIGDGIKNRTRSGSAATSVPGAGSMSCMGLEVNTRRRGLGRSGERARSGFELAPGSSPPRPTLVETQLQG